MAFGIKLKKGKKTLVLGNKGKPFTTRKSAMNRARFIRNLDADLPIRARNKDLKTARVVELRR